MVDLHVQQPGIGEVRLLAPALRAAADRKIVMLQPPHAPQALALAAMGIEPAQVLWLRATRTADMLWAAEQVLKSGSCGALMFCQTQIRNESLRRLCLVAQAGETLFFMMRPLAAAQDPSPAPLPLALRPRAGGIEVEFVKPATRRAAFPADDDWPSSAPASAPAALRSVDASRGGDVVFSRPISHAEHCPSDAKSHPKGGL